LVRWKRQESRSSVLQTMTGLRPVMSDHNRSAER
jgi:hypothetical protein